MQREGFLFGGGRGPFKGSVPVDAVRGEGIVAFSADKDAWKRLAEQQGGVLFIFYRHLAQALDSHPLNEAFAFDTYTGMKIGKFKRFVHAPSLPHPPLTAAQVPQPLSGRTMCCRA